MAINIEWQVKPPGKSEEKQQMFLRIADSEIVNEQQLSDLMASYGSLFRVNTKSDFSDFVEVVANLFREGKTVCIPMLGLFNLSIGTDFEIHPDSSRRKQGIVVRGVSFQSAQEFINAIGKPTVLW